ncbi:uncharacterized protein LODBEIA_P45830 [Lodderomyces beijingensis]|uniref:Diphthamide biosynthesis protein 4 n=1 Tax=Lodderomyces beijingensis TaxID=1775926 RepID=A0ABP0ZQE5_9ASCO
MQTHYEVLNVTSDATQEEIKLAYKQKLLTSHPDKTSSSSSKQPNIIAKIVEAYNVLSNSTSRTAYDKQLESDIKGTGYNISGGGLDVYSLDDFNFVQDKFVKTCPRCEFVDSLVLTEEDLENGTPNNEDGYDIILQCNSCSLWIQVNYFES